MIAESDRSEHQIERSGGTQAERRKNLNSRYKKSSGKWSPEPGERWQLTS